MRIGSHWGAVLLLFVCLASGSADDTPRKGLYKRTLRSTALIEAGPNKGTGWVVDAKRRWLITNSHVVGNQDAVVVTFPMYENGRLVAERVAYRNSSQRVRGSVVDVDLHRDLALIEVESLPANITALPFAKEPPSPGDMVHSVGNPASSDALWVYTSGTVRQVYRKQFYIDGQQVNARVVETQSPINPGDSGGPLVNDAGELVGVNHALRRDAQLVSLSIEAAEVKQFLAAKGSTVAKKKGVPDLLREADEAKRDRNWKLAEQKLTEALKVDPRNVNVWCQLAWVLNEVQAYEDAVLAALAALAIDEKCSFAWRELGFARMQLREWDNALRALVLAIKCDPMNWTAYDSAAIVLRKIGEDDLADELLEKKLDLQLRLKD